jgi:translation initiation factor IF-3
LPGDSVVLPQPLHMLYFEVCLRLQKRRGLGVKTGCDPALRDALLVLGGFIAERNFRQADRTRINERIRAREVRVIDEDGGQLGVMQPFEALRLARERGLDLVEISPTADPPVCKITDYGKYQYQLNKKAHEQRKSSRGSQLKEVKFRPATAEHDYQVRKNQIIRFLGEGHKVRAMIFHRGREMAHQEVGRAKMTRLLGEIGDHCQIETMPRMEGNVLVALLAPKKGSGASARPASPAQANA